MIGRSRVLGIIPARGGSKGLPGKNIAQLGGKPLLAWTIDAARASRFLDRLILSSDDDAIIETARGFGCDVPFRRPDSLASDTAASIEVTLHALQELPGYDVVVLLQPTSPLRTVQDIDAALELFEQSRSTSCVSVTVVEQTPFWMYFVSADKCLRPVLAPPPGVTRRQDLPAVYALNGALYIAQTAWLQQRRTFVGAETIAYVMPPERSIDIDTATDLERVRRLVTEDAHVD